jgi:hypothetical protein
MTTAQFKAINEGALTRLNEFHAQGIRIEQLQQLGTVVEVQALQPAFLRALGEEPDPGDGASITVLVGLAAHLESLRPEQVAGLTQAQIAAATGHHPAFEPWLTPEQWRRMGPAQIAAVADDYFARVPQSHVSSLPSSAISSLRDRHLASVLTDHPAVLNKEQVLAITDAQLEAVASLGEYDGVLKPIIEQDYLALMSQRQREVLGFST